MICSNYTFDSIETSDKSTSISQQNNENMATYERLVFEIMVLNWKQVFIFWSNCVTSVTTGDPLHSRAACTQPCNVNTHSRAHCSPGARLCEQWGHGCVNNGARLCASARLCRGSPVVTFVNLCKSFDFFLWILIKSNHSSKTQWQVFFQCHEWVWSKGSLNWLR